jgi:hypothetical protein
MSKQSQSGNYYRKQHVVPRFIINNFNDAANGAWIHDGNGNISYAGASSKFYWEEKLYGALLDSSWSGYESNASTNISSISAGANALSSYDVFTALRPFIAGMIARERYMHYELSISEWWGDIHHMALDAQRSLIFSAVLTALIPAHISIMRTYRNIIMNDRGYAFDEHDQKLFLPLTPNIVLIVTWGEEMDSNPVVVKNLGSTTFRSVRRDPFKVNDLIARQANMITSRTREDAVSYMPGGSSPGFIRWMSSWLPKPCIFSWLYATAMAIRNDDLYPMDGFGDDIPQAEHVIMDIFHDFGTATTWRPPFIILPDHDDASLVSAVRNDHGNVIFDISRIPYVCGFDWVETKTKVPCRMEIRR